MMEQGEESKVKVLRERFLSDESSKIQTKPAIPEKPKTIPPVSPTTKISNPLIASINSAVENRLAPRVVFKDDKKNRQFSQPETSLIKAKPILLDKNQKKEADLIKQALKNKKIQPITHVAPVLEQPSIPESIQKSPGLETPVKVSSPLKKTIFSKTDKYEEEKTHPSEWDVQATPVLNHSDSRISTPTKAEATVSKPVVPKALVPPVRVNPTISAPVSSPPAVSASKPPALTIPEPVSQNGPQLDNPRPEIPIRLYSKVISPSADIFAHGLPEEATSNPEIPDILDMDIPPPIIPDDFPDGGTSILDISPNGTPEHLFPGASLSVTPISSSPTLSHTASPISATETPDSDTAFTFSPLPTCLVPSTNVKSMEENRITESHKATNHTENPLEVPLSSSPKTISVVSALARAEEMAPVKHKSCDRLLTLLEKSKRKVAMGSWSPTSEILPVVETDLSSNSPLEPSPPETAHAEPFSHVDAPNPPETLMTLPDIPLVDYEGNAKEAATTEYNTQPFETPLNDPDNRKSSPGPKVVTVQRPIVPPPPPPRKPTIVPNGGLTPEKPPQIPSTDMQSTLLPSQPLEDNGIIIPAPVDFMSEDSPYDDSEICDPSETVDSQAESPDYGNLPSAPKDAFLEHSNLEHQTPNMDTTDAEHPRTVTTEHSDSLPDSLLNTTLLSPSGKQINYSGTEMEDLATSKKNKTQKNKTRKGSPKNPYVDPVVTEDIPKKVLFSKKNSVSDEKELKSKEKQKQKDKEKEKEKEKKELKEKEKKEQKEKEKKELREKEKEKEQEKEKEKKEQKDKKKEQKEKERDKKELKEKEREKKEQKEKEKKENEMKKKFRISGEEEALYQAKVTETTKGRKDDLAIKAGEIVSIIRTTDCPKGKWLARDSTNKYGYIPVESVETDIQEMMVLGKKAKANRASINGIIDPRAPSTDIISTHHYIQHQESFEDDSEEWGDEDDTVFPPSHTTDLDLNQNVASPDFGRAPLPAVPAVPAHTDITDNAHSGQAVVHKLTTFFAQPKVPTLKDNTPIKEPELLAVRSEEPVSLLKQETDLQILPPPDLYADIVG